jgi:hypothetical protein
VRPCSLRLGLTDDAAGLAALRALPWQDIQNAANAARYSAQITIDNWSLTDTIPNLFAAACSAMFPFAIGIAHTEWRSNNCDRDDPCAQHKIVWITYICLCAHPYAAGLEACAILAFF